MSMEQYNWLERKGVVDAWAYDSYRQDTRFVYAKRSDINFEVRRKKDIVGWTF